MKQFIFLCALKNGWYGAGRVNHSCEIVLADKLKGGSSWSGGFYNGRPVMITENDYGVQLFNGDTGLILNGDGGLKAMFKTADGTVRELSPAMLPAHETVYAMTVHKSQGSEFDHAAVVLPDTPHRVLTRELIYTAFTRARSKVTIFGTPEVLASAVASPTRRKSGLADMIRGA
jgi:exodeoxyribonuclease V alpha subunit